MGRRIFLLFCLFPSIYCFLNISTDKDSFGLGDSLNITCSGVSEVVPPIITISGKILDEVEGAHLSSSLINGKFADYEYAAHANIDQIQSSLVDNSYYLIIECIQYSSDSNEDIEMIESKKMILPRRDFITYKSIIVINYIGYEGATFIGELPEDAKVQLAKMGGTPNGNSPGISTGKFISLLGKMGFKLTNTIFTPLTMPTLQFKIAGGGGGTMGVMCAFTFERKGY